MGKYGGVPNGIASLTEPVLFGTPPHRNLKVYLQTYGCWLEMTERDSGGIGIDAKRG
jgi:hypothetical protein